jgi:cbb3-type cytochrome oxidase maturation protein
MSVLFVALPVALLLGGAAVFAFVRAVRSGQFDDLDTPPLRMIFDDRDSRHDQRQWPREMARVPQNSTKPNGASQ